MPYILKNRREQVDCIVNLMEEKQIKADGDLNYILFKFCKNNIKPSYNEYKNFIGELRQCATEIERKFLAPYEDLKENENGIVI
jgi:hypothetical protein